MSISRAEVTIQKKATMTFCCTTCHEMVCAVITLNIKGEASHLGYVFREKVKQEMQRVAAEDAQKKALKVYEQMNKGFEQAIFQKVSLDGTCTHCHHEQEWVKTINKAKRQLNVLSFTTLLFFGLFILFSMFRLHSDAAVLFLITSIILGINIPLFKYAKYFTVRRHLRHLTTAEMPHLTPME